MENNPYISADDEALKVKAKKDEVKRTKAEKEETKILLSTIEGRRFIWMLMGRCRVFSSVAHPIDKIQYNAGMQDIGHYLQARVIDSDPDLYLKMIHESKEGKYDV